MLEVAINLFTNPLVGGGFGNLLFRLEQLGFFSYVLPFLFIFILTFAILEKTNILGEGKRGINGVLSLAIGLMALQFQFVSYFFAEIFPRLGIFLSIIIVAMISLALFFDFKLSSTKQVFGWIAAAGVVVIIWQSLNITSLFFGSFGRGNISYWWQLNSGWVLTVGFIALVVLAVFSSGKKAEKKHETLGDVLSKQILKK